MIDKLIGEQATTWIDKTKNVAFGFLIILLWATVFSAVWGLMSQQGFYYSPGKEFFLSCLWAPVWEEAVFRWAPLEIGKKLGKEFIMPVIIISSAIFGWAHGMGPVSLLVQGMMGMVKSWVYLKNNSYVSVVILHALWNIYCFLL